MKRTFVFAVMLLAGITVQAQMLNLASYNVRTATNSDVKQGDGWATRHATLCDFIRFCDYDIFGAQEVRHNQLTDMLAALDGYAYVGEGREGGEKGEYSPIFYKKEALKLLDGGTFWISETPDQISRGWDAKYKRICSWGHFQLRKEKTKFWFFNLHLDHRGIEARREGMKMILERIRTICGKGANVILTGDFNVDQNNEIYDIMADSGVLRDSYELAKVRFAPTGTFNGFDPKKWTERRIDHVWVSAPVSVERYGIVTCHYWTEVDGAEVSMSNFPEEAKARDAQLRLPSDHYPIQVFVKLKK